LDFLEEEGAEKATEPTHYYDGWLSEVMHRTELKTQVQKMRNSLGALRNAVLGK
jgi:hypothetical protein